MRISDTQFSQMMLSSLQVNNAGLGTVLEQMSTGERISKLSDDPIDAIKLLNLDGELDALTQYKANIKRVKTTLSSQEVGLESVNASLKEMRDLVLWGVNGTLTTADRKGIVSKLESLQDAIMSAVNTQDEEGNFLFSGTQSDQPSMAKTAAGYVIQGNADVRLVNVAKGITMESNYTAKAVMDIGGDNVLNQIDRMIAEFQTPTAAMSAVKDATLNMIDQAHGNVLGAMTGIGGRHNNLDLLDNAHAENKLFVEGTAKSIKELDYAEASVRLTSYRAALESTQASYMKIADLSLFNRM